MSEDSSYSSYPDTLDPAPAPAPATVLPPHSSSHSPGAGGGYQHLNIKQLNMLNMFVASLESTFNSSYWSGYSGYSIPPMVDPYYDYPPSYYYPQVDTI